MAAQFERQERRARPGRVLINGHRHQFLAGAGLAGDQDGHVLAGHATDGLVDLAHGRTGADDRAIRVELRLRPGDDARPALAMRVVQRVADHSLQLFEIERLEQIVERALLHRLDGRVGGLGDGDKDHRDAGVEPADFLVNFQARTVGKKQVEKNHVRPMRPQRLESLGRRTSRLDGVRRRGKYVTHLLHN